MENQTEDRFSSKVSLNVVTNAIRTVTMALVGLLMVPYYIDQFGMAVYAILPLATSITTYVLVASDSLASSFTRYLIIAIRSGDERQACITYGSSIIWMFKLILKVLPVVVLISIASPYIFQVGGANALDVQIMFLLILVSALMISFISCLDSVYHSYNLLYRLYNMKTIYAIIQVAMIIVFFMIFGSSLIYVGVSYLLSAIIYLIMMVMGTKRIAPFLKVSRKDYDPVLLKDMSSLGMWAIISKIGAMMFIQASLILVNLIMGPESESEFSIVANLISMTNTVCYTLTYVGEPLIYRYHTENNRRMVDLTLNVFTKFVGLIIVFPIAYAFVFTPQLLNAWIGNEYDNITMMARIMLPANIGVCAMSVMIFIPMIYAKVKEVAIATCILGLVNIVSTCIFLNITDDPVAAAICWSVSILILNIVFTPLYMSKVMGKGRLTFFKPIVICYIMFAVLVSLGWILAGSWTMPSSWLWILPTLIIGFLVYVLIVYRMCLNRDERATVITYLPERIQRMVERDR